METIKEEVLNWYSTEENKGQSSKCLASLAIDKEPDNYTYPFDNSDFQRCVLFKNQCPEAFKKAKEILMQDSDITDYSANVHKVWKGYFEIWEEMETLLQEQIDKKRDGQTLYNIMQKIRENAKQTKG